MTDEKIIALFQSRDERAITECMEQYGRYCLTVASGILPDPGDAEEVVADTWLKAGNAIPPQKSRHLRLFLGRITRNLAIDRWRKSGADRRGGDGVASAKRMHDIYTRNNMSTQILAAGFKNSQQVQELCEYGISCLTIASDVIENLIKNANVTMAVEDFVADFEGLCGKGKTMLDCEE